MTFTTRRIREEKPSRWKKAAARSAPFFARMGALLFGLYGSWKARRTEEIERSARERFLKRCLVILISILFGLIILAGTVKALVSMRILTLHSFLSVTGTDLPEDTNGYTNVLLLGVGDKDHEGIDLTDAIMIASVDPHHTHGVTFLSLPRDLFLMSTEKMGRGRVNELYRNYKYKLRRDGMKEAEASQASMKELAAELGRDLHIQIHRVLKVDFTAFVDVVNTLGGVDVDVPSDLVDPEYPGPNYTYETFEIHAGPQHLDGETALKYARSRHSTSDFSRAARQQQILQAVAKKAKSENIATSPGKITSLMRILQDHVESTMSFSEMLGAAKMGEDVDRANIVSQTLNIDPVYIASPGGFLYTPPRDQFDGASVLLPMSIPDFPITWKQIRAFMSLIVEHRDIYLAKPQIAVLNAGAKSGMGRTLSNEFIRYGFENTESGNASDDKKAPKLPKSVVVAREEKDEPLARFFATLLGLPMSALPEGIDPTKQSQVTVILGTDYTYVPFQTLVAVPDEPPPSSSSSS